ncbi:MAG TPA: ACT domain-containing protein [Phycisphaerae bacterium]|nr:ACT domain-containing protein [Phycisphaerae bacterium]HNU43939.1 ACT domain-containing protein [Phycisphaerae bacterium]
MLYEVSRADMWVGELEDRPGALAERLDKLAALGANLESIVVQRAEDKPGVAQMYVSPLRGAAARETGLSKAGGLHTVRIEGPDRPGMAATISRAVGDAGINMRGFSGAAIGARHAIYITFDCMEDANQATQILLKTLAETPAYQETPPAEGW